MRTLIFCCISFIVSIESVHVRGAINLDSATWPKIVGKEMPVLVKFDKAIFLCEIVVLSK